MTSSFDATALTRLRRVAEVALSPDGTWLAVAVSRPDVDEGRLVSDLWKVPLDGRPPVALTHGDWRDARPRFRRDGSLGFLSNRSLRPSNHDDADDRRSQVWLLPVAGGEPRPLTDEPLGVLDFKFAAAGDRLVLLTEVLLGVADVDQRGVAEFRAKHGPSAKRYTSQPVRHWDAWLADTGLHLIAHDGEGRDRRDLTPTLGHELRNLPGDPSWDISADGAQVVVACGGVGLDRNRDSWIRIIDIASGAHRDRGAVRGISFADLQLAPDSRRVVAVRTERAPRRAEIIRPWCIELDGDDGGRELAAWGPAMRIHGWTIDGRGVLITADDAGTIPAYRLDLASGERVRVTATAAGGCHDALLAHIDGAHLLGVRHRLHHPPEPFIAALAPEAEPRLLASISGFTEANGRAIATWESRWTVGDGGERVQYFLVRPTTTSPTSTIAPSPPPLAPLLLWVHGGPVTQAADGWHWRWNPLVAAANGYAVLQPNPRGSTGRGVAFIDGIMGNTWGAACYQDVIATVDDAIAQPGIDGDRVAAMGGSFGGYMVNWIGTQTERFRCLVSHAGIFAFSAFHGTTDHPPYFALELGQTPYDGELENYRRYSPDAHVERWRTPVLITHGEKDYRVPVTESLLLFEALQLHGVESELVIFPDENHWIRRPRNTREWYRLWLEFVDRHLQVS